MSCGTLVPARSLRFSPTRLLLSLAALSNAFPLSFDSLIAGPQPRKACSPVWAPSISLAATLEIDVSFFSSGYLDVSVPRVPSPYAMYLRMSDWAAPSRVSTFGYQRFDVCLRLPVAFRSLPRPSSVLGALASTLCSSSLDYVFLRPTSFSVSSTSTYFDWSFDSLSSCAVVKIRPRHLSMAPQDIVLMVGRSGLEPPTSRLSGECSNQLS